MKLAKIQNNGKNSVKICIPYKLIKELKWKEEVYSDLKKTGKYLVIRKVKLT